MKKATYSLMPAMTRGRRWRFFLPFYLFILLPFTSCSDFLDEQSQDEVKPTQVSDLEEILLGEAYKACSFFQTEYFTDELQSNGVTNTRYQSQQDAYRFMFRWDKKMFTAEEGGGGTQYWYGPYNNILGCNIVIDYADRMTGDDDVRANLVGEAYTLRGWYYLHLVNLFGKPYNQGDPSQNLGVPLKLNSEVETDYKARNTVKEVYDQIESDLKHGDSLLTNHPQDRNFYRITDVAAKAMLARMYLYQEKWDEALSYANAALEKKSTLLDLWTKTNTNDAPRDYTSVYAVDTPDEIVWMRENNYSSSSVEWGYKPAFTINDSIPGGNVGFTGWNTDEIKDLRMVYYFAWQDIWNDITYNTDYYRESVNKGQRADGFYDYGGNQGIRVAELYLDRAEAYAQKYAATGNTDFMQKAIDDLNTLHQSRYNPMLYTEVAASDFANAQQLIDYVLDERFIELFEETNNRWCDLRRYGKTITHTFRDGNSTQTFTKDMSTYVLPIPEEAIKVNQDLIQDPENR